MIAKQPKPKTCKNPACGISFPPQRLGHQVLRLNALGRCQVWQLGVCGDQQHSIHDVTHGQRRVIQVVAELLNLKR